MVFKTRPLPPPPKDRPPLRDVVPRTIFPDFRFIPLRDHLRAYIYPQKEAPLAHLTLVIPGGRRSDGTKAGLTELTFRMLLEGTRQRSGERLAQELEQVGARLSVQVGWDDVRIELTGLVTGWETALALVLEILNEPAFPAHALDREVQRTIQSVRAQRADPGYLAEMHFRRGVFAPHPYGALEPDVPFLRRVTTDDLQQAYRDRMALREQTWVLVGGGDPESTLQKLETGLADLPHTPAWSEPNPAPVPSTSGAAWIQRPESVQTTIILGVPLDDLQPDAMPAFRVADAVLGGGASSRLFLQLREQRGYTYGAYSRWQMFRFGGLWYTLTQVRATAFAEAFRELQRLLTEFRDRGPERDEVEAAKRYLCGQFNVRHQALQALAQRVADRVTFRLPEDFWNTYGERIRAVDREHLQASVAAWFRPWHVVCVGDLAASGLKNRNQLTGLFGDAPWALHEPENYSLE